MPSQTSITAAALVVAFIIFITVRGELLSYLGALGLGSEALLPSNQARLPNGQICTQTSTGMECAPAPGAGNTNTADGGNGGNDGGANQFTGGGMTDLNAWLDKWFAEYSGLNNCGAGHIGGICGWAGGPLPGFTI